LGGESSRLYGGGLEGASLGTLPKSAGGGTPRRFLPIPETV